MDWKPVTADGHLARHRTDSLRRACRVKHGQAGSLSAETAKGWLSSSRHALEGELDQFFGGLRFAFFLQLAHCFMCIDLFVT
jgi:hypothetical protein